MTAQLIKFPNRFLPAIRRAEKCAVVRLPVVRADRECPKIALLRRQSKMLREHFKRELSGGEA